MDVCDIENKTKLFSQKILEIRMRERFISLIEEPIYAENSNSYDFKVGVNTEILENRKCRNFLSLTVMYIKVCISRMEMSQRIYFWHQNLLQITIFWENSKKTLLWSKKKFKQPTKCNFELN